MAEEKNGLDIDDWLDDLDDDKADVPAEEPFGDLDQSDIDALLGGGDTPPEAGQDDFSELDQSDIDSLLNDSGAVAADAGDLDQSDIDDLFASASVGIDAGAAGVAPPSPAPEEPASQDDIDQMFAELGGSDDSIGGGAATLSEMAQSGAAGPGTEDEGTFGLAGDTGFDDDEFDFGDLPDIPDETIPGAPKKEGLGGVEDIFAAAGGSRDLPDFLAEKTEHITQEASGGAGKKGMPFVRSVTMNKKVMLITALSLLLLVGGGGYFFFSDQKPQEPAVPLALQQNQLAGKPVGQLIPEPAPVVAPNAPPTVVDSQLRMEKEGEAVAIELTGVDAENDPLRFEIVTPPKYGRLSGDVPHLTYLPNKDFPGEDSFEFRVSDGRSASSPAKVAILGPEKPAAPPVEVAEKPKPAKPKRPSVNARDVRLSTLSTKPLTIDWKKIWTQANKASFSGKVSVEIIGSEKHGKLSRVDASTHRYVPDRQFSGSEVLQYRFSHAGQRSRVRDLVINVALGDLPPELRLAPMAKAYTVGESVVLDAGLTKDDSPESLVFKWEQLSGTPVRLDSLNEEGSAVSFVMPSSFYRDGMAKIVIRVTATDLVGQRSAKVMEIGTISRRQSPLWGGNAGDGGPGVLLPGR